MSRTAYPTTAMILIDFLTLLAVVLFSAGIFILSWTVWQTLRDR